MNEADVKVSGLPGRRRRRDVTVFDGGSARIAASCVSNFPTRSPVTLNAKCEPPCSTIVPRASVPSETPSALTASAFGVRLLMPSPKAAH